MGVETAVYAALAAAAIQGYNQYSTAKKQDRAAAEGIRRQGEMQREANARTMAELDTLAKSTPDDEYATRSSQIRDQLRRKQSMALAGIQNLGGGEDVTTMAEMARPQAVDYGDFIGNTLSRIDAPLLQRQGEGFSKADLDAALGMTRRNSAQEDYLTRLKIASIRENPWLTMLSQGLSAYAGGAGGWGGLAAGAAGQAANNLGGQTPQQFYGDMPYANMPLSLFTPANPRRASGVGMNLGG